VGRTSSPVRNRRKWSNQFAGGDARATFFGLADLLLQLAWLFLFDIEPFAKFGVDSLTYLDQSKLHSIQVLMETVFEDFGCRDVGKISQQLAGKSLCFHSVIEIATINPGYFVQRFIY
jgi:hypothetical protein